MVGCPRHPVRLLRRRPRRTSPAPRLSAAPRSRSAPSSLVAARASSSPGPAPREVAIAFRTPGTMLRPGDVGVGRDHRRARRAAGRDRDRDGRPRSGSAAAPARSQHSPRVLGASLVILTFYVAVKGAYQAAVFEARVEERNLLYLAPLLIDCARALRRHPAIRVWALAVAAALRPGRSTLSRSTWSDSKATHPGSRSSRACTTTTSWASPGANRLLYGLIALSVLVGLAPLLLRAAADRDLDRRRRRRALDRLVDLGRDGGGDVLEQLLGPLLQRPPEAPRAGSTRPPGQACGLHRPEDRRPERRSGRWSSGTAACAACGASTARRRAPGLS